MTTLTQLNNKYDYRITKDSIIPPLPEGQDTPTYEYVLEHNEYLDQLQRYHPSYSIRIAAHNLLTSMLDLRMQRQAIIYENLEKEKENYLAGKNTEINYE